jgi:hypothetical protein
VPEFIRFVGKTLHLNITMKVDNSIQAITGSSTPGNIEINLPDLELNTQYKISVLATFLHELAHQFQSKSSFYDKMVINYNSLDIESFTVEDYINYYLQWLEIQPQAISTAIKCIESGIDIFATFNKIDKILATVQSKEDFSSQINTMLSALMDNYKSNVALAGVYDIIMVYAGVKGFKFNLLLSSEEKDKYNKELDIYMKNFKLLYEKFMTFFNKYGLKLQ